MNSFNNDKYFINQKQILHRIDLILEIMLMHNYDHQGISIGFENFLLFYFLLK